MRVLAFAYACEPGRGSEPGAGWIWSRMLARMGEVWVITRESNRGVIEAALPQVPEKENLHFEYVDLPARARFWKRGAKGARLYYLLWQMAALRRARILSRNMPFDLVWHLTWANVWMGALAPLLRHPFVYGPVGGGVGMDWNFVSVVGVRGAALEVLRSAARTVARFVNPLARLPWWRADLILVQNPETRAWLPRRHHEKTIVFPHVVLDEPASERKTVSDRGQPAALFVGRLLPWKGMALALRTLVLLDDWHLIVCGSGPDEHRLKRIAEKLNVDHRVRFLGWVSASRVRELMLGEADVLLFPSLHDEGGFVVAEALAAGLPVVCLQRGGPPEIGGTGVIPTDVSTTVEELARAVPVALRTPIRSFPNIDSSTERLRRLLETRLPYLFDGHEDPASSRTYRVDPRGPVSTIDGGDS
jgi:glycosyltransferase involved in cell wall biosynthesis